MGRPRHLLLLTEMILVLGLAVPAIAADDLDYFDLPPDQLLNAEVISVSKKSEKVADAPAAVFIISQEDIQRSGVTTLPEALRMAPGVNVARVDANSWAISIRGFNGVLANKLLVMIDGRSIYNPLFAGTYWELQDYVLEDIERIEVIRGPGGSLWGANAVNGVINIITKQSKDTQGNLVKAIYGTEEQGTVVARHGGSFGTDNHYRVYAKYFNRDSFRTPDDEDGEDDWKGGRSGFRADWGDNFTLQGDIYRTLTSQLNSTPITTAPFSIIDKETMDSNGFNILARWKKDMDDGALLSVQSYIDYTDRDQILLKDRRGIFDTEIQYNFVPSDRHEIITGGGYRYIQDDLENAPSVTFNPASRTDNYFNVFLQDKITLAPDRLFLTLGSKLEHNDYTGYEIQPNARLQYHLDSSQMLWASVSRAVRTPSRLEHDLTQTVTVLPPATVVELRSNRDFDSEKLIAYEGGYRKQINRALAVDIATFFNDYDQLSTVGFLTPAAGLLPINAINGMTGETYGGEIAASWDVSDNVRINASYSYLNMTLHVADNGGFDLETAEDTSPQHQANVRANWQVSDNVSLDTSVYYVSELKEDDVDDYVRLDLNLGWKVSDQVSLNLIGQNLLEESHREFSSPSSLNASEVERTVFGRLTWKF